MTSTGEHLERRTFTSFDTSTAEDWAVIRAQMKVSQAMVAEHVLMLLRALASDHGGYPVTRLEHSLQTATRAERDGRDDEYVLCSLIHDIGDTLAPYDHPAIAATILRGRVSEANLFMVEQHGVFQGIYFWHYIGQDQHAREQFRDSPFFDRTAEFCALYDQVSFDPDYLSEPLEHYEPLVREFFAARL
ncbi:MAG: HD domain-containing protein [Acidimicrobiia bacterium]